MASITRESNGRKTIQFVVGDGRRKSLRLGAVSDEQAVVVKDHVEHLVQCEKYGKPWCGGTDRWLVLLEKDASQNWLYDRLAACGLVPLRAGQAGGETLLGAFIDEYIQCRTDVKPATVRHLKDARRSLVAFFGENRPMEEITPGDADEFRVYLLGTMGDNTARRRCGRAKQFFRAAKRKKLIGENPFEDMKGCNVRANKNRDFFVSRELASQVLAACPDNEWRLLFALARFAALRIPSEVVELRWADVNWETQRFTVHSSKTEHHENGGIRVVPIFPELLPYLEAQFEAASDGTEFVISHRRNASTNFRTQLQRIIKKAGLVPWPKLWQNLRLTRATELASEHPGHVATAWCGHSTRVAEEHYWRVTEEDYAKACKAVQNPVQNGVESGRNEHEAKVSRNAKPLELQGVSTSCEIVHKKLVPPQGLEP